MNKDMENVIKFIAEKQNKQLMNICKRTNNCRLCKNSSGERN